MKNIYRKILIFLLATIITTIPFSKANAKDIDSLCVFIGIGDTLDFSTNQTKNWIWKSNNTYIATVKNGKITGKHLGYAIITAKNGKQTYDWYVKVIKKTPSLEYTYFVDDSIPKGISNKKLILGSGDLEEIFLNKIRGNVVWSVSNSKVVEIEPQGVSCWIQTKKAGTATIKATVNGKTYTCKVTVIKKGIQLSKKTVTVKVGKKQKIHVTSADDLTASTYDYDIIDCNWGKTTGNKSELYIKGLKAGTGYIDIESEHTNESKTIKVVVLENVKLNKSSVNIYDGKTYKLKVSGTKSRVKWSSSNKKIATVSSSGTVKGIKPGTAYITATIGKQTLK